MALETIKEILMRRDGMDSESADEMIEAARDELREEGSDPEEVLEYWFGLEPDYVFDLLEGM